MGKITEKEALLNLLKNIDVGQIRNQQILKPLLKKLAQSRTVSEEVNLSNAKIIALEAKIKSTGNYSSIIYYILINFKSFNS